MHPISTRIKLTESGKKAHHQRLHAAVGTVMSHVSGSVPGDKGVMSDCCVSVRWDNVMRRSGGKGISARASGPATTVGHWMHFEEIT